MKSESSAATWFVEWMRRAGLNHFAASMLDGFEPAAIVLAQLAFLADPFIGSYQGSLTDLGRALEDPALRAALVEELDKDSV
jgi:hypothetical protein